MFLLTENGDVTVGIDRDQGFSVGGERRLVNGRAPFTLDNVEESIKRASRFYRPRDDVSVVSARNENTETRGSDYSTLCDISITNLTKEIVLLLHKNVC